MLRLSLQEVSQILRFDALGELLVFFDEIGDLIPPGTDPPHKPVENARDEADGSCRRINILQRILERRVVQEVLVEGRKQDFEPFALERPSRPKSLRRFA